MLLVSIDRYSSRRIDLVSRANLLWLLAAGNARVPQVFSILACPPLGRVIRSSLKPVLLGTAVPFVSEAASVRHGSVNEPFQRLDTGPVDPLAIATGRGDAIADEP